MKTINIGILGGGEVASHLIGYLIEYPFINIKYIGVKDLEKPRYFDRYNFNKTLDLQSIVTDESIDLVIDCLNDDLVAHDMTLAALQNNKDVISCNKILWGSDKIDDLIKSANDKQKTIWLNSLVCSRDSNELVLPKDLTHRNIKAQDLNYLLSSRNCQGAQAGLSITQDIFRFLNSAPDFEIVFDKTFFIERYEKQFEEINNDIFLVKDFLQTNEHEILKNLIVNLPKGQVEEYIKYKKMEEYKDYCQTFLKRTDYENAYREGAVYGGLDLFKVTEAVPIPKDLSEEIISRVLPAFNGNFLHTGFNEAVMLPNHAGEDRIERKLSKKDQIVSSYKLIYFVNEPDEYSGGEFTFANQDIKVSVKANTLLIYRNTPKEYVYSIAPVENGIKYFLELDLWVDVYNK